MSFREGVQKKCYPELVSGSKTRRNLDAETSSA